MNDRTEVLTVPYVFCLRIHPELKEVIGKAADAQHLPMNEFIARVLADHLKCPELAIIPRKSIGRPRNAEVKNGKSKKQTVPA